MLVFVFERLENVMEKGEILVTGIFSISDNVFKRPLSSTVKIQDCLA